jgi:hypothetical protein
LWEKNQQNLTEFPVIYTPARQIIMFFYKL